MSIIMSPTSPSTTLLNTGFLDHAEHGITHLHVHICDFVHKQIGQLPLSEAAITWLRQIPGILDACWKHGIPRKQQTNKVRDTLHDLHATLEASPRVFSGYANLKANSIRVGSLVIAKGPYGFLSVRVWRRGDDGYEHGLGHQDYMLAASPERHRSYFADHDAELAHRVIQDILCAPDVLIRACARTGF